MNSLSKVFGIPLDYDGNCDEMCDEAFAAIDALPAIDAVPVVRCKECCYLSKDGKSPFCTYHDNINVTEEFFCATGEVEHADARKPV